MDGTHPGAGSFEELFRDRVAIGAKEEALWLHRLLNDFRRSNEREEPQQGLTENFSIRGHDFLNAAIFPGKGLNQARQDYGWLSEIGTWHFSGGTANAGTYRAAYQQAGLAVVLSTAKHQCGPAFSESTTYLHAILYGAWALSRNKG